jgi:8-oxo-dGTP pyrophosphatase MutT (NUDIX family)
LATYHATVSFEVPAAIAGHVAAWGGGEPAAARDAATVVLLRDAADGLEVFLLHRVRGMAAFGGMTVFPGGSVDPADIDSDDVPWAGPGPQAWAQPLSAAPALARGLVCAAVRETFEEAGVLLAGAAPDQVVADTSAPEWETARGALEARELSLSTLLSERGLCLRADLLRPWAHWITPVQEKRRFDTRFFVAALPRGQRTAATTGEAERVGWARPAEALAARARGEVIMVPPTAITLAELAEYATVDDVLAAERKITPVLPRLVPGGDGVRFLLPTDPDYDT